MKNLLETYKEMHELEEKTLYKSPTGWKFELVRGEVVMSHKNAGKIGIPASDFKVLKKIIGQVDV